VPGDMLLNHSLGIKFLDKVSAPRMENYIKAYFGASCVDFDCIIPLSRKSVEEVTAGFDVPDTDMAVALRPNNNFVETPDSVKMKLKQWADLPARNKSMLVFDGSSVLGNPRLLDTVADEIKLHPAIPVGYVELVQQDGLEELVHKIPEHLVSVHSITQREMEAMKEPLAVARMSRAVRERKVEALYLRLFVRESGLSPADTLTMNVEYVRHVADAIKKGGKTLGVVEPMPAFNVPWILRALIVGGAAALVLLLASITLGVSPTLGLVLSALALLAYPAAKVSGHEVLYLKLAALGAGSLVPGLAAAAFFLAPYNHYDGSGAKMPIGKNLASWVGVTLLTAAAGIMIAALLAQRDFYLRLDLFPGVKVALVLPFLIVLYCFIRTSRMSLAEFFNSPVRYIEAAAALLLLGGLAIYLIRSGNQAAAANPAGAEMHMRNWLETVLVIRPRTKEFLIGHPAMILLGMVPFVRKNYFYLIALMVGVVGQAGLLNTFCHLHTPIGITVARVVLGAILGAIVGLSLRVAMLAGARLFKVGV
jgi:hypothetical protein